MTLIFAMIAKDGIVLASDSQMTTASYDTRAKGIKVWGNEAAQFVFGLYGDEACMQSWRETLVAASADDLLDVTAPVLREKVENTAKQVLGRQYELVQATGGALPASGVVFASYVDGEPCLLHAQFDATVVDRTENGFVAAGSGAPFGAHAFTVFSKIDRRALPLSRARVLAQRIVEDAITIAGAGLGGDVQMATISSDGAVTVYDEDEQKGIADEAESWRLAEAERFLGAEALT